METFIMIIVVIVAIIIAFITWKLFPLSLSRHDYYRNSPLEILKQRGVMTFAVFVVICIFGYYGIIGTMRKQKLKQKKYDTESVFSKEPKRKKHIHRKTKSYSNTDTLVNNSLDQSSVDSKQILSEEENNKSQEITETKAAVDSL